MIVAITGVIDQSIHISTVRIDSMFILVAGVINQIIGVGTGG